MLDQIHLKDFTTLNGKTQDIELSYQLFGKALHSAPIVLVNHALTGNSHITGEQGWWSALIGDGKCIDTVKYTVLAFNIPGNGYDGFVIDNYKDFVAGDVARIFFNGAGKSSNKTAFCHHRRIAGRRHCLGNGGPEPKNHTAFDTGSF